MVGIPSSLAGVVWLGWSVVGVAAVLTAAGAASIIRRGIQFSASTRDVASVPAP